MECWRNCTYNMPSAWRIFPTIMELFETQVRSLLLPISIKASKSSMDFSLSLEFCSLDHIKLESGGNLQAIARRTHLPPLENTMGLPLYLAPSKGQHILSSCFGCLVNEWSNIRHNSLIATTSTCHLTIASCTSFGPRIKLTIPNAGPIPL